MSSSSIDCLPIVMAAGKGNRMPNLTEYMPKLLLPVANIPLYWYPLNMLHRNGFKDCILIVPKDQKAHIEDALDGKLPALPGLKIQIIIVNEADDEDEGTADVIRHLLNKKKIPSVLIVSGDMVTDLSIKKFLEFHETNDSMFTCLLTDSALGGAVPGTKDKPKKYRDFVMFSPGTNQLHYLVDEDDYGDVENLPEKLFTSSPQVQLTAKYKDVHLYAIKRKALLALIKKKTHSSLKADLIPQLLYGQFSNLKRQSLGLDQPYKCFAYQCATEDCFTMIAQCNHIGAYFEANKAVQKILPKIQPNMAVRKFDKSTGVNCTESLVDASAEIGEKCQIKRSTIDAGCKIGNGAKIDNSVLMRNVTIQSSATIKNSIVFDGAQIGEKVDLAMCIVAPRQEVKQKAKLNGVIVSEEKEMKLMD